MGGVFLSFYGWAAVSILILMILLATVKMFVDTPKSKLGKHILAMTPILLGIFFIFVLPRDTLYLTETMSNFVRTIIPFVCIVISIPLVYKANKEIKKEQ